MIFLIAAAAAIAIDNDFIHLPSPDFILISYLAYYNPAYRPFQTTPACKVAAKRIFLERQSGPGRFLKKK
jgi:hypothetical protein